MLDVFNGSAFSIVRLTDTINNIEAEVPRTIERMGLFRATPVDTTAIDIEERNGVLTMIGPTPRGGPGHTIQRGGRALRTLRAPHFEINDSVMAEEVQNIRAFGSDDALESVAEKVTERLAEHADTMDATEEYARIGAVKGVITYADGSQTNLFTEFGVTQAAEIAFDLSAATPAPGILRQRCAQAVRTVKLGMRGVPMRGVRALTGTAFFDALIAHPEVRDTYLGWAQAEELRAGYGDTAFPFGGIRWELYEGEVDGVTFVHTDKAHLFPDAPVFRSYYAPADYVETVNTRGKRLYSKQYPIANGKGIHLDTQMNALNICLRPLALVQARRGA